MRRETCTRHGNEIHLCEIHCFDEGVSEQCNIVDLFSYRNDKMLSATVILTVVMSIRTIHLQKNPQSDHVQADGSLQSSHSSEWSRSVV